MGATGEDGPTGETGQTGQTGATGGTGGTGAQGASGGPGVEYFIAVTGASGWSVDRNVDAFGNITYTLTYTES